MDFLSYITVIISFLAIITIYCLKTSRISNINAKHETRAPEPPGAWPFIGHLHLLGGQSPVARTLGAIADKHGPIFSLRLGTQQALVVSNWELIKECFTTRDRVFATRPNMAISKYLGYKYAAFALAPYGPYWRDVRKMVTLQLFTTHRLDKLRHVCASELNHVIKTLYSLT
ncbi:hypothetical protein BUALT_Bualt13G0116700 [Buddleja alternifolia]|uniref:Cytochrome P450 n=1 Tax=Buddleja alternifolia TaxID=168488 RepID=A0AAV6WTG1_9LAMI|nr:hypothetical protein BUALT_Bualt13G0116700 [Buddleja alternifolia]